MLLVKTHSVQGATNTIIPAGSTLPQLTTPNQMYVELRWSSASVLSLPANAWTTIPYNSIARYRNFNVSNLGSSLAGGVGSIFLDMPGLYLITGGWRTVVQGYTNTNFTAITVNDEVNRKDAISSGTSNNAFTFLKYIFPEELIALHHKRAKLLIQAYVTAGQDLALFSAIPDDREPPVWCHIAFLG